MSDKLSANIELITNFHKPALRAKIPNIPNILKLGFGDFYFQAV